MSAPSAAPIDRIEALVPTLPSCSLLRRLILGSRTPDHMCSPTADGSFSI